MTVASVFVKTDYLILNAGKKKEMRIAGQKIKWFIRITGIGKQKEESFSDTKINK